MRPPRNHKQYTWHVGKNEKDDGYCTPTIERLDKSREIKHLGIRDRWNDLKYAVFHALLFIECFFSQDQTLQYGFGVFCRFCCPLPSFCADDAGDSRDAVA